MWLKPLFISFIFNRQLKQTAKNSVTFKIDAYSLPFTLVNGLLQLFVHGWGFNPISTIIN
jgi:hypothetical protein